MVDRGYLWAGEVLSSVNLSVQAIMLQLHISRAFGEHFWLSNLLTSILASCEIHLYIYTAQGGVMARLPLGFSVTMSNNWPYFAHHPDHSSALGPHQLPPAVGAPASWADEFIDFAAARRGHRRRSVAFLGAPIADQCPGFDRLDDDQLLSMFSDEVPPPSSSSAGVPVSSTSTPSDHDSAHEGKPAAGPEEAQSVCKTEADASALAPPAAGSEPILDPKRVKRILANRQSAQRSRVRKLQYISELERSVNTLQGEVSALSPRVAFLDHQRSILAMDNSHLKQRIAVLAQDKIFKDAHQEALKKEVERLKQVYCQQNVDEMATSTSEPVGLAEKELID